jgi:hypothetical protein
VAVVDPIDSQRYGTFCSRVPRCFTVTVCKSPPDLPSSCDRCNQKSSVRHALECKKGGFINSRHNKIRDELSDPASKALFPSAVRDEPKIHTCRNSEVKLDKENKENSEKRLFHNNRNEDRGDILIRGLHGRAARRTALSMFGLPMSMPSRILKHKLKAEKERE